VILLGRSVGGGGGWYVIRGSRGGYGVEEERVVSDCEEEKFPGGSMWEGGSWYAIRGSREDIQVEERGKVR
jgi:hypothetical protein